MLLLSLYVTLCVGGLVLVNKYIYNISSSSDQTSNRNMMYKLNIENIWCVHQVMYPHIRLYIRQIVDR